MICFHGYASHMSSTNTRSSSSRTATPSEIGEVRGAYLSSLGAVKPPETIDWSKLLENPGAGGFTDTNRKFQKTRTEPSIPADTADRFLKRGPIAKTSQPLQVRPEDKPSDASRLDKVQALPAIKLLLSMDTSVDSDSSLKGHHDPRESRERQELSATDTGIERPPVVRNLQEAFEREDTPSVDSVDSSTGPAARVLANVHTIEELEADLDLLEEDGNVGRKGSGHHPHSSTRQGAGPGRQSIGSRDVSSVGGYSIEEDFESASEVRTQIEDEENNVSTEEGEGEITEEITEGITEEIAEEEGEVVNTDTLGLEVTEDEEVATETQHMVGGATRQSGRSSDDGDSTSGDTEHSDHTVIESSVVRPSYYEGHSSANGTRSAMPDGLGTPSSTPGGLGTHADGGGMMLWDVVMWSKWPILLQHQAQGQVYHKDPGAMLVCRLMWWRRRGYMPIPVSREIWALPPSSLLSLELMHYKVCWVFEGGW